MQNIIVYAWRRPSVGYSLQLIVDHTDRTICRGYCLAFSADKVLPTRKALNELAEALQAAGYTLEEC